MKSIGVKDVYSAYEGKTGKQIFSEGFIDCNLKINEILKASLIVRNSMTGQELSSPEMEVIGPHSTRLSTGVVPFVCIDGVIFISHLKVNYQGNSIVSTTLILT